MSATTASLMLGGIVLMPAMLAGPLGWVIFRAVEKQRNRLKAVVEDPDPEDRLRHGPHMLPAKPQIAVESRTESPSQFANGESRQRKRRR
jgi:hypothetical protein